MWSNVYFWVGVRRSGSNRRRFVEVPPSRLVDPSANDRLVQDVEIQ